MAASSAHLENVVDDEVAADDDKQQRHVDPAEEAELPSELSPREVGDKGHEACVRQDQQLRENKSAPDAHR